MVGALRLHMDPGTSRRTRKAPARHDDYFSVETLKSRCQGEEVEEEEEVVEEEMGKKKKKKEEMAMLVVRAAELPKRIVHPAGCTTELDALLYDSGDDRPWTEVLREQSSLERRRKIELIMKEREAAAPVVVAGPPAAEDSDVVWEDMDDCRRRCKVKQRTEAWLRVRKGHITASTFSSVLGIPPDTSFRDDARKVAFEEKTGQQVGCFVYADVRACGARPYANIPDRRIRRWLKRPPP